MEFELFNDGWRGYTLGLGDLWESEFLLCAVGVCMFIGGDTLFLIDCSCVFNCCVFFQVFFDVRDISYIRTVELSFNAV